MKKVILSLLALVCAFGMTQAQSREGLSEYKLDNGLTVLLWEDHDQPDVEGYVAVRAGAVDEPAEYTGLAHYLEHMMFKGTQTIGALDWASEKLIYDSIIALYDQYSESTDPKVREQLATQINECSMREAKISSTEDFFNLLDLIGSEGVNAFTSYDMTCYHNSFPAAEMNRWLTIFSDRLMNPVFRTFQAELENVFEEYNMYANDPSDQVQNQILADLYAGCPYERNVIGKADHLKNPRLSKLIEFYETWYVPNNMALILVGDFNTEEVKPLIAKTFSRLESKPLPERPTYQETSMTGFKSYKMGYQPQIVWAFPGCKTTDADADVLEFVCALLYNGQTGLLDKLNIDGDVTMTYAYSDSRRLTGRVMIEAVPYYDANQQMFESNKATEKIVMEQVNRLKTGDIPDWVIASVKKMYDMSYKRAFENSNTKMSSLVECFIYNKPLDEIFTQNERIQSLTKEDIMRVATQYFSQDHMTLSFDEGTVKANTLPKPKIKPLDPVKNAKTAYAEAFKQLSKGQLKQTFNNFEDVTVSAVADKVTLHYTPNTKNDIFSLRLRYGVGEHEMPMLPYAAMLMNDAGVQPSTEAQEFQRQLAELGASVSYDCDDSYFYISISGEDGSLDKIMQLVSRQLLMPKLEQKKLDNIKGQVYFSRLSRTKKTTAQTNALLAYALLGEKSGFIDEVKFTDVWNMNLNKVQSQVAQARTYALDIFYCGTKTADEVVKAMPLTEGMQASKSPYIAERKTYDKPTILFLPNSNIQQANLYFYFNGKPYNIQEDVAIDAFNQYFSGGFSGLVMNEIRTKRSMAYTAYGMVRTPQLPEKKTSFMGYIGTQSDKVADAVEVFMNLLDSMPADSSNIEALRAALKQASQTAKPSMRGKASTFEYWQQLGYNDDPARVNAQKIQDLTFDQIQQYYEQNIKGQNVAVILIGDPKKINIKAIEARVGCKVTKVSTGKIFAPLETDF